MIYYLVHAAFLEREPGLHLLSDNESLECIDPSLRWVGTSDNERDALLIADTCRNDARCVATVVCEYCNDDDTVITTGNYGALHLALNARIERMIDVRERPFKQIKRVAANRYHEVTFGDWVNGDVNMQPVLIRSGTSIQWSPLRLDNVASHFKSFI